MVELVGGPYDGELLHRGRPAPFVWIDARLRLCSGPADDRSLYRFAGERTDPARGRVFFYEYAELQIVRCEHCGFFTPREAERCALCDRPLTTL